MLCRAQEYTKDWTLRVVSRQARIYSKAMVAREVPHQRERCACEVLCQQKDIRAKGEPGDHFRGRILQGILVLVDTTYLHKFDWT